MLEAWPNTATLDLASEPMRFFAHRIASLRLVERSKTRFNHQEKQRVESHEEDGLHSRGEETT